MPGWREGSTCAGAPPARLDRRLVASLQILPAGDGSAAPTTGHLAMTLETWAAFAAATAILLVIPGPTILLVISYALGQGWRTAFPMAVGVALGDFTAMTLSMLGVGALLATSATVFTLLKWLGAAYLVWLGLKRSEERRVGKESKFGCGPDEVKGELKTAARAR